MNFRSDAFLVTLTDDPPFNVGSADNARSYDRVHDFTESYGASSRHGVRCREVGADGGERSCILLADGGATRVREHSAVLLERRCYVAVGPMLCALALPELDLVWATKVDTATCFGAYRAPEFDGLISHGELEIARVSLDGQILWAAGGRDIFTGAFRLEDSAVLVEDFYGHLYRIDIVTGACSDAP